MDPPRKRLAIGIQAILLQLAAFCFCFRLHARQRGGPVGVARIRGRKLPEEVPFGARGRLERIHHAPKEHDGKERILPVFVHVRRAAGHDEIGQRFILPEKLLGRAFWHRHKGGDEVFGVNGVHAAGILTQVAHCQVAALLARERRELAF